MSVLERPTVASAPDTRTPPASWEDWVERFAPITNPECGGQWDGFLFETHGTELYRVSQSAQVRPGTVWTLLDCDGHFVIADGMHRVNRFGFFITERAYTGAPCEFVDDDDDQDREIEAQREAEWAEMNPEHEEDLGQVAEHIEEAPAETGDETGDESREH